MRIASIATAVFPPRALPRAANSYRPDIDGLRALAVIPVILFHAGLSFPGGFIGVDVFFVISGYLITQIIEKDFSRSQFSVIAFYQRRVRRIFPALFAMFALSLLLAYQLMPPSELEDFALSLRASASFSSNILFYWQAGYFAPQGENQPLLHTWTLSLEEQFYLFWPIMLRVLHTRAMSRWKIPVIVSILLGSLVLSQHWLSDAPKAAFYLLPSRAWELALGALLASAPVSTLLARIPRPVASVSSLGGISMVVSAAMFYGRMTAFPGFAALLPCLGAALILAAGAGGSSLGGNLLSRSPLVWTGLISYSLYLWHVPVLFFGRLLALHPLGPAARIGLVTLSFAVAWLSWRFVETPFRQSRSLPSRNGIWVGAGLAASVAFIALGTVLLAQKGLPERRPGFTRLMEQLKRDQASLEASPCLVRGASLPETTGCLLGAPSPNARYQVSLWGDSHAAHLAPAMNAVGQRLGVTVREIAKVGCAPLPGIAFLPRDEMRLDCPAFNEAAWKTVLETEAARVLVMAGRWDAFTVRFDGELRLSRDGRQTSFPDSHRLFVSTLRDSLIRFTSTGRQVILVGLVPLPPPGFITCLTRAWFNSRDEDLCSAGVFGERAASEQLVTQALREASAGLEPAVRLVSPFDSFCAARECSVQSGGRLLYVDDWHLSSYGARRLENSLSRSLAAALAATRPIH